MTIKATPFVLPVLCALYSLTGETSYQTREPRGPSPSGGKTPANPHVSLRPLRGKAAQSGVQGYCPCLDDVVLFEELFDVGAGNLAHHCLEGQLLQ